MTEAYTGQEYLVGGDVVAVEFKVPPKPLSETVTNKSLYLIFLQL